MRASSASGVSLLRVLPLRYSVSAPPPCAATSACTGSVTSRTSLGGSAGVSAAMANVPAPIKKAVMAAVVRFGLR